MLDPLGTCLYLKKKIKQFKEQADREGKLDWEPGPPSEKKPFLAKSILIYGGLACLIAVILIAILVQRL